MLPNQPRTHRFGDLGADDLHEITGKAIASGCIDMEHTYAGVVGPLAVPFYQGKGGRTIRDEDIDTSWNGPQAL